MSGMEGNKHYGQAVSIPEGIEIWDAPDVPAALLEANAEATLALAFEQRTANLIAYQANVERSYISKLQTPRSDYADKLNQAIIERLGLL